MRAFLLLLALCATPAFAQKNPFPDAPGRQVLVDKCFQCHTPRMWMDHRQDRRGWESTLYRMVGRGALWSEDDIKAMADYLGKVYSK
jgi:hypothetical protein